MRNYLFAGIVLAITAVAGAQGAESAGSLKTVAYHGLAEFPVHKVFDIGEVELQFSSKPPTPDVSINPSNSEVTETFFFPMVDASSDICGGGKNKTVEVEGDRSYSVSISCVTGKKTGLKVAFRYKPEHVSVKCHVGYRYGNESAVFRVHDHKKLQHAQMFRALRMVAGCKVECAYALS